MGLDMYLHKRTFVGMQYEHVREDGNEIRLIGPRFDKIDAHKISEITEQVAYWRKANAIHKWFVDHVQDGVDDCGHYEVSTDQLHELHNTVVEVLASVQLVDGEVENGSTYTPKDGWVDNVEMGKVVLDSTVCEKLLPVVGGFFFGGTNYDQWYVRELEYTRDQLQQVLDDADEFEHTFTYYASW